MKNKHIPVLLNESLKYLNIKENGIYVDCTLGRAGHSSKILENLTNGFLYCLDQDPTSIEYSYNKLSKISSNFEIIKTNFVNLKTVLSLKNVTKVDGILYDLGVSSPQFDIPERGFSYRFEGPLDMRMDTVNNSLTAEYVLNNYSEEQLIDILYKYGEEKYAKSIVKNIIENRPLKTTIDLVNIIKKSLPVKILKKPKHPAKKTFQALRIYINNELEFLENSLIQASQILNIHGRIVVITFHSLEEKIVKKIFNSLTFDENEWINKRLPINIKNNSNFRLLIKKPIKPNSNELIENKRSHSAKLWIIEKIKYN